MALVKQDACNIEAIATALYDVNQALGAQGLGPVSTSTIVNFLVARDFDVEKAVKLFINYHTQMNLYRMTSPFKDPLRKELVSGRFTVLETRDLDETATAIFYAQRCTSEIDHNVVWQSICFQLDEALKNRIVRKYGIVLLYDFTEITFKGCDLKLCTKILNLLTNAYPIKVRTMYMISPPFWFKPTMNIFSKLLREQNTIAIINRQQLLQCMPGSRIPENLGGTLRHDHVAWINQCLYSHSNRGETEKECWKTERGLVNTSYSDPSSRLEARLRKEGLDWE